MKRSIYSILVLLGVQLGFANNSRICENDRVNFGTYVGTAVEVFSNGNVKIDVDGYSGYTYKNVRELGKGVRCLPHSFCENDRVNFGSYVGTAVEVFDNGTVKIDVDGYSGYSYKNVREIGQEVHCSTDQICENDRVNFGSYVGTATEVFNNGTVKIDVDGYSGYSYKQTYQLGRGVDSLAGLYARERVNFGSYTGTALEIFDNGTVKIDVDGYSGYSYKNIRDLGYEVSCYNRNRRNICGR